MGVIYVIEKHHQLLSLWRAQQASSLQVLHLDFHCDLRGLLINRQARRAYRIWDRYPAVDQGNFLTHAILEGQVEGIRWVYDEPGGREYDIGTVKYETDLTALPHRLLLNLRQERGLPIHYDAVPYADWPGLIEDEVLDIDWDFFACTEYAADTIQDRVEAFLNRQFYPIPDQIYICYSPDYSHPSRTLFRRFVGDLAQLFTAEVVEFPISPNPSTKRAIQGEYKPSLLRQWARQLYRNASLGLKKRGVY
jgi:uncharacterized protein YbaR (Trm112 family)